MFIAAQGEHPASVHARDVRAEERGVRGHHLLCATINHRAAVDRAPHRFGAFGRGAGHTRWSRLRPATGGRCDGHDKGPDRAKRISIMPSSPPSTRGLGARHRPAPRAVTPVCARPAPPASFPLCPRPVTAHRDSGPDPLTTPVIRQQGRVPSRGRRAAPAAVAPSRVLAQPEPDGSPLRPSADGGGAAGHRRHPRTGQGGGPV